MTRTIFWVLLAILVIGISGCKSNPGSREYIPGKGWVPN
jgi:uncharacterized lipoprotein